MLRTTFSEALKAAMRSKNSLRVSTIRLIMATLKDCDIAVREKGNHEGISEPEILQMLQGMVKQRKESAILYEQGDRLDLVEQEKAEINILQEFLPPVLSLEETTKVVSDILEKLNAHSIKDMGRVMSELRENYVGQMDFSVASQILKENLR